MNLHCKPIPCNDYRDPPVWLFSQGNPCNEYSVPAMRTGVPCNENRCAPVRIYYTGKALFWPCTDPVRDYSVVSGIVLGHPNAACGPRTQRNLLPTIFD